MTDDIVIFGPGSCGKTVTGRTVTQHHPAFGLPYGSAADLGTEMHRQVEADLFLATADYSEIEERILAHAQGGGYGLLAAALRNMDLTRRFEEASRLTYEEVAKGFESMRSHPLISLAAAGAMVMLAGASAAISPQPIISGVGHRERTVAKGPNRKYRRRSFKGSGGQSYAAGAYKGSKAAKRATKRGGNPAAYA